MRVSAVLSLTLLAAAAAPAPVGAQAPRTAVPEIAGLKITGSIPGKARRFRVGERVPLEVVVHNSTKAAASVNYLDGWWFYGPSVSLTRNGKPAEVRYTRAYGAVATEGQNLQPGATVRIRHAGLYLGKPGAAKSQAAPYLVNARPGKYLIRVQFRSEPVGSGGASLVTLDPPLEIEIVERGSGQPNSPRRRRGR